MVFNDGYFRGVINSKHFPDYVLTLLGYDYNYEEDIQIEGNYDRDGCIEDFCIHTKDGTDYFNNKDILRVWKDGDDVIFDIILSKAQWK